MISSDNGRMGVEHQTQPRSTVCRLAAVAEANMIDWSRRRSIHWYDRRTPGGDMKATMTSTVTSLLHDIGNFGQHLA